MKRSARLAGIWVALITALSLMAAGCPDKKQADQPKVKEPSAVAAKTARARPVLKASADDCVGPLKRSKKPKEIAIGDHKFKLDGYLLTQLTSDPDKEIVIGVVSDSKENTEKNQRNLNKIMDFFKKEKVEAIVHLGDIASNTPMQDEIEVPDKDKQGKPLAEELKNRIRQRMINKARTDSMKKSNDDMIEIISILADTEARLPVLVLSGNRECKTIFNKALATLAESHPNVFNMNMIRRVDLDDLDIISMPGYHDPEYVHCPWDKCLYYGSDTLSIIELAKEANSEVLLISHGPPRQKSRDGIDVVSEGANVGNKAMSEAIHKAKIFFGAFGNIQEAGGKATNLEGNTIITQDTFVSSLYLNPGPSDSMFWKMNDGTESQGMAAVIHFVGKKAKYKIFRIDEEK